jgi:hypothetical protein
MRGFDGSNCACGGRLAGNGTRSVRLPFAAGGAFLWSDVEIRRFRCRQCGRTREASAAVTAAVAESQAAVAFSVAASGVKATASLTGLDAKTVVRWTESWVDGFASVLTLPATTILRRSSAASSRLVVDAEAGEVVRVIAIDAPSLAGFAAMVDLHGVATVLIDFDLTAREALRSTSALVAVAPAFAAPRLGAVLAGAGDGLEAAIVAAEVERSGWTASTVAHLQAVVASQRSRLFFDAWGKDIVAGLEGGLGSDPAVAYSDPACHPTRLAAAFACAMQSGNGGGVPLGDFVAALERFGIDDRREMQAPA